MIVLLWFTISVPLTSVGAWFGGKHGVRISTHYLGRILTAWQPLPALLRVNQIPRQIPPPPKYLRPVVCAIVIRRAWSMPDHSSAICACNRAFALRRRFHGRLLPPLQHFRVPSLLCLRLPRHDLPGCRTHDCDRLHSLRLLPVVCRRLPMALAKFRGGRWERRLAADLWRVLLDLSIEFGLVCKRRAVFWVSAYFGDDRLYCHW